MINTSIQPQQPGASVNRVPGMMQPFSAFMPQRQPEAVQPTGGLNQARNFAQNMGGGTWSGGRAAAPGGAGAAGKGMAQPGPLSIAGGVSAAGGPAGGGNMVSPSPTMPTVMGAPAATNYSTPGVPQISAYGTTWDAGTFSGTAPGTTTGTLPPANMVPSAPGMNRPGYRSDAGGLPGRGRPEGMRPDRTRPGSPGYVPPTTSAPSSGQNTTPVPPAYALVPDGVNVMPAATRSMDWAQGQLANALYSSLFLGNPTRDDLANYSYGAMRDPAMDYYTLAGFRAGVGIPEGIPQGMYAPSVDVIRAYANDPALANLSGWQAQQQYIADSLAKRMLAGEFSTPYNAAPPPAPNAAMTAGMSAVPQPTAVTPIPTALPGTSAIPAFTETVPSPTPLPPAPTKDLLQQGVQDLYYNTFGPTRTVAPAELDYWANAFGAANSPGGATITPEEMQTWLAASEPERRSTAESLGLPYMPYSYATGQAGVGAGLARGGPVRGYARGGPVRGYAEGSLVELSDRYGMMPDYVTMPEGEEPRDQLPTMPVAAQVPEQPQARVAAAPMVSPEQALNQMLQKYVSGEGGLYGAELRKARTAAERETTAFNDMIQRAITSKDRDSGPSREEMYFRLAAAMGKPTRTGRFSESLGEAAGVLGEVGRERRAAQKAGQAEVLQLGVAAQKARAEAAKADLSNLRSLAGEEMRDVRSLALKEIERQIAAGKPQSEAGKVAVDSGLKPGTPAYQQFVEKYVSEKISSGNMFKEAMATIAAGQLGVAQGNLAVRQASEGRAAAAEAKKERTLTPAEIKLRDETESELNASTSALSALSKAYELNPNTFTGAGPDIVQRKALELSGAKSEKLTNTRIMENLLGSQALEQLKVIFGGAPTEGERAILLDLQGMGAKSLDERAEIIKRAAQLVRQREVRARRKLDEIRSGRYKAVTSEQPQEAE